MSLGFNFMLLLIFRACLNIFFLKLNKNKHLEIFKLMS